MLAAAYAVHGDGGGCCGNGGEKVFDDVFWVEIDSDGGGLIRRLLYFCLLGERMEEERPLQRAAVALSPALVVCLVCLAGVGPASSRLERLLQSCDETAANEQVVWLQVKLNFYNVEPSNPIELLPMEAEKLKAVIAARLLLLSQTPRRLERQLGHKTLS